MAEQLTVLPTTTVTAGAIKRTPTGEQQWIRDASLLVLPPKLNEGDADAQLQSERALDLSELRFTFQISQADYETPNTAAIRVYNLSEPTVRKIRGEYSRVVVQAGYKNAAAGVIFQGDIRQIFTGRENNVDSYLDIFAADGDLGYSYGQTNRTWGPGTSAKQVAQDLATDMGFTLGAFPDLTGPAGLTGPNLDIVFNGKIGFGISRALMRNVADAMGCTWSIQNGQVQIVPLQGYMPGEAVVINALTGMIGIPVQTDAGIQFRCLLNSRLRIGTLVQLNNKDINQLIESKGPPTPYNRPYSGLQFAAKVVEAADGLYRLYVVEHVGDTRGQPWYSECVCLAVDRSANQVIAKN